MFSSFKTCSGKKRPALPFFSQFSSSIHHLQQAASLKFSLLPFFGVGRNSGGQQSRPANLANMKCMTEGARLYDVLGLQFAKEFCLGLWLGSPHIESICSLIQYLTKKNQGLHQFFQMKGAWRCFSMAPMAKFSGYHRIRSNISTDRIFFFC